MKYKGIKYKRKVTSGRTCGLCDILTTTKCNRLGKCMSKDHKKGNKGYYKEVS